MNNTDTKIAHAENESLRAQAAERAVPAEWSALEDELHAEMNRRFGLSRREDDAMRIDDTQIGVEFAVDWLKARLAASPTQPVPEPAQSSRVLYGDEPMGDQSYTPLPASTAQQVSNMTAPEDGMVSVTKLDANRYCEILTLLGMEDEGDPVEEVQKLQDRAELASLDVLGQLVAARAAPVATERVYLVNTGEIRNGHELYERHEKPVPLADQEVLYTTAPVSAAPGAPSEWDVRGKLAASLTFRHRLKDKEDDELVALFQKWAKPAAEDSVLAYLDGLSDDAAAHIYPNDLRRCETSECTATVYSVRVGSPDGKTVPLFSRQQVVAALSAAPQPPAPSATADALTIEDAELLQKAVTDFEDCGETDVPDAALRRFAAAGYLECVHYHVMPAARDAITATMAAKGAK